MEVHFQHWKYEIADELLCRFGSPYYAPNVAGKALQEEMIKSVTRLTECTLPFDRRQVLCANEAFPEAAVAEPLEDLELWDEWNSGHRVFPYPGKFSRLGIRKQESKTPSPSSVGVVGEIFAGLFAQAFISPQVLTRPIHHWPDLIFYSGNEVYSFVESKAFTERASLSKKLPERLPWNLVREFLLFAVTQLNADPYLEIWGSFTGIVSIVPRIVSAVTFLQIVPSTGKGASHKQRVLPQAVVDGVAERAIAQAILRMPPDLVGAFCEREGEAEMVRGSGRRKEAEKLLESVSAGEIECVLSDASTDVAAQSSRGHIEEEIRRRVRHYKISEDMPGRRFYSVKTSEEVGVLKPLRDTSGGKLFMADLGASHLTSVGETWSADWERANRAAGQAKGTPVWRCGGMAFCLGQALLEKETIRFY